MSVENKDTALDKIAKVKENEKLKQEVLAELLAEVLLDDGHVLVTKSHMGTSDSYLGTVSFRWIDKNVGIFTELPLFKSKIDPETGNLVIDHATVADLRQRAPHWDRQYGLATYLLRQRHRKFPPILVVVYEKWVNKKDEEDWEEDGGAKRAKKTSMPIRYLDPDGRIGLIDTRSGVTIFAIDGSHRTIAIKALMQAVGPKRVLSVLNKAKREVRTIPLEEVLEAANLTEADIEGIEDETMGVEFIPAIMKGETREEARRRIRSVFVHVNKTAAPPTAGEQLILDEDDGYAIITRQVALSHPLFKRDKPGDRVNWKSTSIPAGTMWISPAIIMMDMASRLLGVKKPYDKWKPEKKREIPLRPTDDELAEGETEMAEFFDKLASLPSFSAILRGDDMDDWREFPELDKNPTAKAHLLMRPLGQLALARAVGFLHNYPAPDGPEMELDLIFDKLRAADGAGAFNRVDLQASIWYGVTYDPVKKKMEMSNQVLAADLFIHLLGGASPETRDELLKAFRLARTLPGTDDKMVFLNYDGSQVDSSNKIQLPPLW